MGFFSGRLTFTRFKVSGTSPGIFGPEHPERLADHAIGKARLMSGDGVEVGWVGGDHILDTQFDLAKNVVNDTLHFGLRIDQQKIPGDLLRAYTAVDLQALAAANPSGRPSARQRREARDSARDRLEQEAADGRFLKRKSFPVLWDAQSNELLAGTSSVTALDRLLPMFERTFDKKFEPLYAGRQAYALAEAREQTRQVDDAHPSAFIPGTTPGELVWQPDEASRDFVGNEFLLWLWYYLDHESDTISLGDGSDVAVMIVRSLALECPRGVTGRESISSDAPGRLPESRRAIQAGKLPRKVGLILVRHDQQYEMTLQAETLSVSGAKLPTPEEEGEDERARLEGRVDMLRHLIETLDLMFDAFGRIRFSSTWPVELSKMQKWLQQEDQRMAG